MKLVHLLTIGAAALTIAGTAAAQNYPTKPITAIVPFPPGGSSDATLRVMSGKLGELLGQPVVIDNKAGANGSIGAGLAARARPDGYTILIGSVGTWAITPLLLKSVTYDPRKDFDLLTMAVRTPNVVVVTPSFPANNMQELIAYMKKNPGAVTFASAGTGSTDHLSALLLWQKTGTDGLHVGYRGGGSAITDVIGGHSNVIITNMGVLTGHIAAGKLKPLAVTSETRMPQLPNVPTLAEQGLAGLEVYSWQGIAAPRGLPAPVREKLERAMAETLKDAKVRATLETAGFEVLGTTPAEFARDLDAEIKRWKTVIDTAGIKAE